MGNSITLPCYPYKINSSGFVNTGFFKLYDGHDLKNSNKPVSIFVLEKDENPLVVIELALAHLRVLDVDYI
jgi:hypothetical protein